MDQLETSYFQPLLTTTPGLHAILLTDREGIPIAKTISLGSPHGFADQLPSRPLSATFASTTDQMSRVGLGEASMIVSTFDAHNIVQRTIYVSCERGNSDTIPVGSETSGHAAAVVLPGKSEKTQWIITLIADTEVLVGRLMEMTKEIMQVIQASCYR